MLLLLKNVRLWFVVTIRVEEPETSCRIHISGTRISYSIQSIPTNPKLFNAVKEQPSLFTTFYLGPRCSKAERPPHAPGRTMKLTELAGFNSGQNQQS